MTARASAAFAEVMEAHSGSWKAWRPSGFEAPAQTTTKNQPLTTRGQSFKSELLYKIYMLRSTISGQTFRSLSTMWNDFLSCCLFTI